ncbi:MAG: oligoendopeptidase F [Clostridia bacterium]|nr:oligoendopeptidase F [Clostridia bacterium]
MAAQNGEDCRLHWDMTRLFATDEDWEEAYQKAGAGAEDFAGRAGTLGGGREKTLSALTEYMELNQGLERLYTYAMMKLHEDTSNGKYQGMQDRAASLASRMAAASAFLTPELLALPEEELQGMAADERFADYDVFLQEILRTKPHVLGAKEERLMAMATEVTGVPENTAELLMGADLDLGKTISEDGSKIQLTEAGFIPLMSSESRIVRRKAYTAMMQGYGRMGNTFAALYGGQVKADIFAARARGYASCREAALFPDQVQPSVYDSLIESVHGGIGTLCAYLEAKQRRLGVPKLHLYDLYAEKKTDFEISPDIDEAFRIFLDSVKPLGADYVRDASRALPERWIDVMPAKNKRAGAYSTGVYGTTPYVLLNHKPTYDGLSTLAHEMGHAMHTFYSSAAQPYAKADYTIFVAEVASTTNEILLCEHLRRVYKGNRDAQLALIGSLLEHFRTTVFRQTMFAEFEMKAHSMAENGESLTRDSLCELYYGLNRLYYGKACAVDKAVETEWMRIPHFYSPFYVYKYATGFCAAAALSRNILSGDPAKVAAYRKFLTLGGSMPPIEELKVAGVDMSTPAPVCEALDYFAELLLEYTALLAQED